MMLEIVEYKEHDKRAMQQLSCEIFAEYLPVI
jgi:hypothetical protein